MRRPPPPRPRRGPDPTRSSARSRGALLGLAVGDALGATLELKRLHAPPFPTLADGPHRDITGGGPFQVKPGQVTDETQVACCVAQSLKVLGRYDRSDVAARLAQWRPHAFDIGQQTLQVLEGLAGGLRPDDAGRLLWLKGSRDLAGNGSLARTAPIGVFFARDAARRVEASLEDSTLTHFDFRCQLACAAFNGAIAGAITAPAAAKPDALVAAAQADLTAARALAGRRCPEFIDDVTRAGEALQADLDAARSSDPLLYGPELHLFHHHGSVRVAFRLAFWELLHAPSFEAGLIDVVNRGGDADTHGAIAGALLGAWHGEEQIPERWRCAVLEALLQGRPSPLATEYHPKRLLELAEGR